MDDFGGRLRQARERRGISLRQIAAITRISAAALDALERNDISKLPGGLFSRAFVRSYAVEVGLDPEETVREFLERFAQEPASSAERVSAAIPEHERTFQEQRRKAARALAIGGACVVLLIIAAVFAWRARASRLTHPAASTAAASTGAASTAAAATAPASTGAASAAAASTTAAATPAQSTTGEANPAAPAAAAQQTSPPVAGRTMTLDVHPISECWVSLTVDGTKLFARVMKPGEHESHTVAREAVVEIGNAGAFAFSIDGRQGKSVGGPGQVTILKLTPATASEYVR
jgi:cytoskeletal protein RodZ